MFVSSALKAWSRATALHRRSAPHMVNDRCGAFVVYAS